MIEFLLGLSPGILVATIILAFIALISQMSLYAKAGQPAVSALVPVWNVVVFCKVVGRPKLHSLFLIIPGVIIAVVIAFDWTLIDGLFPVYGSEGQLLDGPTSMSDVIVPFSIIGAAMLPLAYFVILLFIEVCDSFGKHSNIDKLMCIIFNGFYILFVLGISDATYEAPWWAKKRGLPYYMPDFKHKGKKYLVTPQGPITGNPADQKVKVEIVDEDVAASVDAQIASAEHITSLSEKDKVSDVSKVKNVEKEKKSSQLNKVVEVKKAVTKSSKKVKPSDSKKEKENQKSTEEQKKSWREEMAEKYKKK